MNHVVTHETDSLRFFYMLEIVRIIPSRFPDYPLTGKASPAKNAFV